MLLRRSGIYPALLSAHQANILLECFSERFSALQSPTRILNVNVIECMRLYSEFFRANAYRASADAVHNRQFLRF